MGKKPFLLVIQKVINKPLEIMLPNCDKILERLIFKRLFELLIELNITLFMRMYFKTGISSINKIQSNTHEI